MNLYNILIYSWYIFFTLSKLGLWESADVYLDKSAYYLKMYIDSIQNRKKVLDKKFKNPFLYLIND